MHTDKNWFYLQYVENKKVIILYEQVKKKRYGTVFSQEKWNFTLTSYSSLNECGKVVETYFNEFISIFHYLSVLMVKGMEDHAEITERIIHLTYNMRGFGYAKEAADLSNSALLRMFICGQEYYKVSTQNESPTRYC